MDVAGSKQYYFHHQPAWLHCQGSLGVRFLVAACSQEDDWDGLTFSTLLDHDRCPLCGMHGFRVGDQWAHLLISCEGVGATQVGRRYGFVQHVCRALGVPLAYFSMSHHVASLMIGLLHHVKL